MRNLSNYYPSKSTRDNQISFHTKNRFIRNQETNAISGIRHTEVIGIPFSNLLSNQHQNFRKSNLLLSNNPIEKLKTDQPEALLRQIMQKVKNGGGGPFVGAFPQKKICSFKYRGPYSVEGKVISISNKGDRIEITIFGVVTPGASERDHDTGTVKVWEGWLKGGNTMVAGWSYLNSGVVLSFPNPPEDDADESSLEAFRLAKENNVRIGFEYMNEYT